MKKPLSNEFENYGDYRKATYAYCEYKCSELENTKKLHGDIRLYVWENVLCDWTCGIAFALAYSENDARYMVLEKCNTMFDWPKDEWLWQDFLDDEPKVYNTPIGYAVGGGA